MSLLTPEELREIQRLHLQAGRRVDALLAGEYRSAVRGRGMEFEEVRAYVPGDDVRHIDWNVTARTGEPFIKVFREERQNTVMLAVDVSGSIHTGTGGRDGKTDRRLQVARLAAGIAWAGQRNRDRVGLMTFSDQIETVIPPRPSRGHTWAILRELYESEARHQGTDLAAALKHLATVQRRRATLILVSDFLDEGPWEAVLAPLCRRHTVFAFCVHDALDDGLPGLGLVNVVDAETGLTRTIDAAALTGLLPLETRLERLRRTGARAWPLHVDEDPFALLHRAFSGPGGRR